MAYSYIYVIIKLIPINPAIIIEKSKLFQPIITKVPIKISINVPIPILEFDFFPPRRWQPWHFTVRSGCAPEALQGGKTNQLVEKSEENHWKIHHFSTSSCKDLGEKIANPLVKSITFLMMVRANDIFQPHVSCFLGVKRELFAHVMCLPSLWRNVVWYVFSQWFRNLRGQGRINPKPNSGLLNS